MKAALYALAERIQPQLLRGHEQAADPANWVAGVPRVLIDSWASLVRWHEGGERVWRISAAAADETGDMALPADLPLATARVRAEAVAYQLPDRSQWIVIARHAPPPREVVVHGDIRWAFAQPVLTYCTEVDGTVCAGYYSLVDYPTAGALPIVPELPGTHISPAGVRVLGDAETTEEDARFTLALLQHYIPHAPLPPQH